MQHDAAAILEPDGLEGVKIARHTVVIGLRELDNDEVNVALNTAELDALFDEKSVFVHMGGAMTKAQELNVIESRGIQFKKADVKDISALHR